MNHEVYVLNRRKTLLTRRILNADAKIIEADINDEVQVETVLQDLSFDVVADFVCYTQENALRDIRLFGTKCKQFVFVSSAGGYVREGYYTPIDENRAMQSIA
mgnify:FL=1